MATLVDGNAVLAAADAAFRQAARQVIDRSRRTGTPVIVWENDRVVELTPDEAESRLEASQQRLSTGERSA